MFTLLHRLFVILYKLRLFDIYRISDLEKCVHYSVRLGIPWPETVKALRSIYDKINNDHMWRVEDEFRSLLTPVERTIYDCDNVPESTYIRTLVQMMSMEGRKD